MPMNRSSVGVFSMSSKNELRFNQAEEEDRKEDRNYGLRDPPPPAGQNARSCKSSPVSDCSKQEKNMFV